VFVFRFREARFEGGAEMFGCIEDRLHKWRGATPVFLQLGTELSFGAEELVERRERFSCFAGGEVKVGFGIARALLACPTPRQHACSILLVTFA